MKIHKLDKYDLDFLQSLIDNEIEESIHIEFKRAEALSKIHSAKKEISKDVSAFANSDGGIIIYGIEEKNHKAYKFSYVDGTIFTKEWLEQVISSTINRTIEDLKIFPIRFESKIEKSIYVVQIPSSIDAPHMSIEKRFYKRHNFESVMMEEYEIRQLYGRKLKSKLILGDTRIGMLREQYDDKKYIYFFEVAVINNGEVLEQDYKVNIHFENMVNNMNILWEDFGSKRDYYYTNMGNGTGKVSGIGKPIYPNEMITIINFNFDLPRISLEKAYKELKFRITLLYPNGDETFELNFGNLKKRLSNPNNDD
ncbi:helix-turn-helix domain-containing protein [Aquimarina sp. W85]|uniref:AlbA family DNA-binding domain-containing protein n=1 Tax=Aquimarina rhodophyticola TaxID=3342246 RepID=UPI00367163D7